jgi:hypothetical protein
MPAVGNKLVKIVPVLRVDDLVRKCMFSKNRAGAPEV